MTDDKNDKRRLNQVPMEIVALSALNGARVVTRGRTYEQLGHSTVILPPTQEHDWDLESVESLTTTNVPGVASPTFFGVWKMSEAQKQSLRTRVEEGP